MGKYGYVRKFLKWVTEKKSDYKSKKSKTYEQIAEELGIFQSAIHEYILKNPKRFRQYKVITGKRQRITWQGVEIIRKNILKEDNKETDR